MRARPGVGPGSLKPGTVSARRGAGDTREKRAGVGGGSLPSSQVSAVGPHPRNTPQQPPPRLWLGPQLPSYRNKTFHAARSSPSLVLVAPASVRIPPSAPGLAATQTRRRTSEARALAGSPGAADPRREGGGGATGPPPRTWRRALTRGPRAGTHRENPPGGPTRLDKTKSQRASPGRPGHSARVHARVRAWVRGAAQKPQAVSRTESGAFSFETASTTFSLQPTLLVAQYFSLHPSHLFLYTFFNLMHNFIGSDW